MSKIFITGASGFIGTNLVERLLVSGHSIFNFDINPPLNGDQQDYWHCGDIMNIDALHNAIQVFEPEIIVHLAARTDTLSPDLEDYKVNTLGSVNVLNAVQSATTVKRLIMTSTQYVYKSDSNPFPSTDIDFKPHTVYGTSKVISEKETRKANLACCWTIIRPANIWGPWHMRYPNELWKVIKKGYYVHPGFSPTIRTYGYVKNVVHQIEEIMQAPLQDVNGKVFYVGDLPVDSFQWLNEISVQLRQKPLLRIPSLAIQIPAWVGDIARYIGINAPIHSVRYKNMTEDFYAPTNVTVARFGIANGSLKENVKETIDWIRAFHPKKALFKEN
jgi:nucleoside-diphosphate-sugar epimerase